MINTETDYTVLKEDGSLQTRCDLDAIIQAQGEFSKFIYGCKANNELLPFQSETFDSYIANLSLQLVPNRKNMIIESFRVLKQGGAACFTIWATPEKCNQFTILSQVFAEFKQTPMVQNAYFDHWADKGAGIRQELTEVGFKDIRMWEQPTNVFCKNGQEYVDKFAAVEIDTFKKMNNLDDVQLQSIKEKCAQAYNEKNKETLNTFCVVMILAHK